MPSIRTVSPVLHLNVSPSTTEATVHASPGGRFPCTACSAASMLARPLPAHSGCPAAASAVALFSMMLLTCEGFRPGFSDSMSAARPATCGVENDVHFKVVGIFRVGNVFGDSASMLPLTTLQANERKPGDVTLAFVKAKPGANIDQMRSTIEHDQPELATVRTVSDFGRVDRNLQLISAANVAISILALVIGAIGVMNTMIMSVFERTREFGVLRAVGWTRARVITLVMSEALLIALVGAVVGVAMGFVAIKLLERVPEVIGVFQPAYTADVFGRALGIAVGMAIIGTVYPAVRAALLQPLDALRHE